MQRIAFISYVLWLGLAGLAPVVRAQAVLCQSELTQADDLYTRGRFDASIDLLNTCLRRQGVSVSERRQAYRLMSLNYIAKDLVEDAKATISDLINMVPNYEADLDEDPPAFVRLVNEMKAEHTANEPPSVRTPISDQTLIVGQGAFTHNLSQSIVDPEGATLQFMAASSNADVAQVEVLGTRLLVQPLQAGTTAVTVEATDSRQQRITFTFIVTVNTSPIVQVPAPVETKSDPKEEQPDLKIESPKAGGGGLLKWILIGGGLAAGGVAAAIVSGGGGNNGGGTANPPPSGLSQLPSPPVLPSGN